MLSSVYRNLNRGLKRRGLPRVSIKGLKRQAKRQLLDKKAQATSAVLATPPFKLFAEARRTLDIFQADWDIDFVIRDEDLHPREND